MQLIEISKPLYRKRLNIVIVSFITAFLFLSLGLGSLIISFFGDLLIENAAGEMELNNFRYNLLGVLLALLACAAVLHQIKNKPFFKEIYYVWSLKQLHNKIYRKVKKIKLSAKNEDVNALIILNFYYHSRKQVYLLDDNTLTIPELEKDIRQLDEVADCLNLTISLSQFDQSLLASY
ncbi:MAG: DUF3087 domain-containing protein [Colwellia sp.]|nr:DUF3087 domain-containing protein [Colwellia sp.]